MKYSKEREDEVVVSWDKGEDAFWGKSFLSLRKGRWSNDEVISGFFLLLRQQEYKGKYFFRTHFALQLLKDGKYCYTEVERYFSTKQRRMKKTIFMYDHYQREPYVGPGLDVMYGRYIRDGTWNTAIVGAVCDTCTRI